MRQQLIDQLLLKGFTTYQGDQDLMAKYFDNIFGYLVYNIRIMEENMMFDLNYYKKSWYIEITKPDNMANHFRAYLNMSIYKIY